MTESGQKAPQPIGGERARDARVAPEADENQPAGAAQPPNWASRRRFEESEGSEGCLHPKGGITAADQDSPPRRSVADLQLDTVACKHPSVFPRKVVVPGSCHPVAITR